MSGYSVEFLAPDGTTLSVDAADIQAPDVPDEHSVINEFRFEVPFSPDLEAFRYGSVALSFEADDGATRLIQAGPVDAINSDDERGVTTV